MKNYALVLWDLDGTVVDPSDGIIRSIRYALKNLGIEDPGEESLRNFIGPPLHDSFRSAFHLDDETVKEAVRLYRVEFSERGLFMARPYDGIRDLLEKACDEGIEQVIATSKPGQYARKILNYGGIEKFFAGIYGANMDGTMSSKKDVVKKAIENRPERLRNSAVVIGDRKYEVEAARQFGVRSIAVGYGYGTIDELSNAGPDYIAESVEELWNLLLPNG